MMDNQSFGVDDIRRIRDEAAIRYQGMTPEEISKDISEGAKEGYAILERLKRERLEREKAESEKAKRQGA